MNCIYLEYPRRTYFKKIQTSQGSLEKRNKDTFANIFHSKSHLGKELEEVQQIFIMDEIMEDKNLHETTLSSHI